MGKSHTPTRASRSSRTGRQRSRAGSIKTKVKQPVRKITREGHITCNVILKRFACLRGFESPCCQGRSSGPGKRLRGQLPASILQTRPAEAPKDTFQTIRLTLVKTTSPPPRSCRDIVSYVWCRQSLLEHSVVVESFNADSVPFEPFPWLISIPKRVSELVRILW